MASLPGLPKAAQRKVDLLWAALLSAPWPRVGVTDEETWSGDEQFRSSDPLHTDRFVGLGKALFTVLSCAYWPVWELSGAPHETFVGWLRVIAAQVSKKVAALPRYNKLLTPNVRAELDVLIRNEKQRAIDHELRTLEAHSDVADGDDGVPKPSGPVVPAEADFRTPAFNSTSAPGGTEEIKAQRKRLRDEYKAECKKHGIKVTDEMIAHAANSSWNTRDPVQKWLACHPNYEQTGHRIREVFRKKPHLSKGASGVPQ